jgi:hypothetical protein
MAIARAPEDCVPGMTGRRVPPIRYASAADSIGALCLAGDSLAALVGELDAYTPSCWHASRTPVVRVLAGRVRLAE